jgi:hypothetical protein
VKRLLIRYNSFIGKSLVAADRRGFARIKDRKHDRRRRQEFRREIMEGCRAMMNVYLDMEQAYNPLEEEVAQALDVSPCDGLNSNPEAWYTSA